MKRLIIFFALLLLTAFAGVAISKHSGYVLIAYDNTTIETTLWIPLLALFLLLIIAYILLRVSNDIGYLTQKIGDYLQHHRQTKIQRAFNEGLQKLLLGEWVKAEKILSDNIAIITSEQRRKQRPEAETVSALLSNYLAAAYAANKQHNYVQRDNYLNVVQQLYHGDSRGLFTIAICRVRLLLQSKQDEEAFTLLCYLQQNYRQHKKFLQRIISTYLGDYESKNISRR